MIESDLESESDCDSQPDLDSVFKAGGGDEVMDEDLWKDHPVQRQVAEPSPFQCQPNLQRKPSLQRKLSLQKKIPAKTNLMLVMAWVEDLMTGVREKERM